MTVCNGCPIRPAGADSERALLEAHYLAGQYADSQFQRVDEMVTSSDFAEKRAEAVRMREEAAQFRQRSAAAASAMDRKDFARQHMSLSRSAELDDAELRQAEDDRAAFQRQAVASYLRCLQLGRRRDLLVYRLVALWLADTSGQVCELLRPAAPRLPAFKLVPPLYQLAARLGRPCWLPASAQLLEELLERCAAEHPHHTLPVLLALKNAHADAAGGAAPASDPAGELRTAAATRLVKRLRGKPALAEPLRQLEAVSAALVKLAYHVHRGASSTGTVRLRAAEARPAAGHGCADGATAGPGRRRLLRRADRPPLGQVRHGRRGERAQKATLPWQ